MSDRIPVLLDTDIGNDIDDAVCLAYLLRQPRCELVGVTTVTGDVKKRAACVKVVCDEAGRSDIPIHAGTSNVILHGVGQPNVPQFAALARRNPSTDFPSATAIEFLRRTIRSRPGEITLLSIGPYSNLALLFAIDPEIPGLLKQIVSMAGIFYPAFPCTEWNCRVDPIATQMIYRRPLPNHLSVGLDVTRQCQMAAAEVRPRFRANPLNVVLEMAEVWFNEHPDAKITFHDPLAGALIFKPEICTYEEGIIEVPIDRDPNFWGRTHFFPSATATPRKPGDPPPPEHVNRIARRVDRDAFFEEYFSVFK